MAYTVEYVDVANTGIVLLQNESKAIPRRHERVIIGDGIIGKVDTVDWTIKEDSTRAVVRVEIDYGDTDRSNLPKHHPQHKTD